MLVFGKMILDDLWVYANYSSVYSYMIKKIKFTDVEVIKACRKYLRGACGDSLDKLSGENYTVLLVFPEYLSSLRYDNILYKCCSSNDLAEDSNPLSSLNTQQETVPSTNGVVW